MTLLIRWSSAQDPSPGPCFSTYCTIDYRDGNGQYDERYVIYDNHTEHPEGERNIYPRVKEKKKPKKSTTTPNKTPTKKTKVSAQNRTKKKRRKKEKKQHHPTQAPVCINGAHINTFCGFLLLSSTTALCIATPESTPSANSLE